MKYLVIYYDGDNFRAAMLKSETPNSSVPRQWGLPDDCSITAVCEVASVENVWIDEELVELN